MRANSNCTHTCTYESLHVYKKEQKRQKRIRNSNVFTLFFSHTCIHRSEYTNSHLHTYIHSQVLSLIRHTCECFNTKTHTHTHTYVRNAILAHIHICLYSLQNYFSLCFEHMYIHIHFHIHIKMSSSCSQYLLPPSSLDE